MSIVHSNLIDIQQYSHTISKLNMLDHSTNHDTMFFKQGH